MACRRHWLALLIWLLPGAVLADAVADGLHAWRGGDYRAARSNWLLAAEAGEPQAMFLLSELYARGQGVPPNPSKAVSWLTAAAEAGYPPACYNLGDRYLKGEGVTADPALAALWWRRAAVQGLMLAQYNLGTLYYRGLGVPADPAQAAWWYSQAAAQGSQPARQALAALQGAGVALPAETAAQDLAPTNARVAAEVPGDRTALPRTAPAAGVQARSAVPTPAAVASPSADEAAGPAPDFARLALGPDWLRRQPPDHFIVQVFASNDATAVTRFLTNYRFSRQVAVYPFSKGGTRWYAVTYGRFVDHAEARAAMAELPPAVRKGQPWIRQVKDMTGILEDGDG